MNDDDDEQYNRIGRGPTTLVESEPSNVGMMEMGDGNAKCDHLRNSGGGGESDGGIIFSTQLFAYVHIFIIIKDFFIHPLTGPPFDTWLQPDWALRPRGVWVPLC